MIRTAVLGFPRMGKNRELKRHLEAHWAGKLSESELEERAKHLRAEHRSLQQEAGIARRPSNDFSLYDHVLDLAHAFGAYEAHADEPSCLQEYFLLARGRSNSGRVGRALEMTKWFDTNYHYLVPEISEETQLRLRFNKPRKAFQEALAEGQVTIPVILGPVSFLLLAKNPEPGGPPPLSRLADLLPIYGQLLAELAAAGAIEVQMDEPCLAQDLSLEAQQAYRVAYTELRRLSPTSELLLATYFGSVLPHLDLLVGLEVHGLHVDLVSAPEQLPDVAHRWPQERLLSLGVVDGRNVWRADARDVVARLRPIVEARGPNHLVIATSCSLLHCPFDLQQEVQLDPEIRGWLSFAVQKMHELTLIAQALTDPSSVENALLRTSFDLDGKKNNPRVHRPHVEEQLAQINAGQLQRALPYEQRAALQREVLGLPPLPTTTIGSFPQTDEIRRTRASYRAGLLARSEYERFVDAEILDAIARQERLGLDVLVHGEPERTDMVEYFATQMEGFAQTEHGWVQSYGSRCVKPPIIYGDVYRPEAMTVRESTVAQRATAKPVKAMLTGPLTLLKWSFVRNDQPLEKTALQLALAIRAEVLDLERAGLKIIQVDEPGLREALPLRQGERAAYSRWAVEAFRLATAGARPETQIHTHMCYAEFRDVLDEIVAMDADVLSIESARSRTELLDDFRRARYPNEVGPGVYDIHSPRVPTTHEMADLLRSACRVIPAERLWVNPDCGLKTRSWPEVTEALVNMVQAAEQVRREL